MPCSFPLFLHYRHLHLWRALLWVQFEHVTFCMSFSFIMFPYSDLFCSSCFIFCPSYEKLMQQCMNKEEWSAGHLLFWALLEKELGGSRSWWHVCYVTQQQKIAASSWSGQVKWYGSILRSQMRTQKCKVLSSKLLGSSWSKCYFNLSL